MRINILIKRQENSKTEPYLQVIPFECDVHESVSNLLEKLNTTVGLQDIDHKPVRKIAWECSCSQKKCGACAMLINHAPRLACNTFIRDVIGENQCLTLEPLSKFPVISDLKVDRSILYENLKEMKLWLETQEKESEYQNQLRYQAAKCLMCGCCLEICPNFLPDGKFTGAAIVPITFGVLKQEDLNVHKKEVRKKYTKYFYEGCGDSLACRDVCPMNLPMEELLVRTNSLVLWRK